MEKEKERPYGYDKNVLIDCMCELYSENELEENVKENKVKAKVEEFKRLYNYNTL